MNSSVLKELLVLHCEYSRAHPFKHSEEGSVGPGRGKQQEGGDNCIHCEIHNWYSSPDIVRVIKSTGMWWVGHVVRLRVKRRWCDKTDMK
jgi:hypothetical protein